MPPDSIALRTPGTRSTHCQALLARSTRRKRNGSGQFCAEPKRSKQNRREKYFELILTIRQLGFSRIDKDQDIPARCVGATQNELDRWATPAASAASPHC